MKFFLCLAYTQVLQKKEKERGEGGGWRESLYTGFMPLPLSVVFGSWSQVMIVQTL